MLNVDEYFARKREELDFGRADVLARVQDVVDEWYPGEVRVKRLDKGVLTLTATKATIANELRLRQVELFKRSNLNEARLVISITA